MPLVRIGIWEGRDEATKEKLIQNLTKTVSEIIACPPQAVIVVIEDIPKTNWGSGGIQGSKAYKT